MSAHSDEQPQSDIVKFLTNKDFAEWSSISESKKSESSLNRGRRIKTLPQAHWHDIDKVTADLKATLPWVEPKDVRRYRMPYHEAILIELEDLGYKRAAYSLRDLLDLDEKVGRKTPGMLAWKKPYLKDQKEFLDRLKDSLLAFEEAEKIDDHITSAAAVLDTALFFQSKTWEWWWIAEHFYQAALSVAVFIQDDELRTITLIRYLYGRFLFNELQNPEDALDYLNEAREVAKRRTWNASTKLGQKQSSIFKECNILLYKALLILARKVRATDPDQSLKFCTKALERATDTDRNEYIAETLYELGKSYIQVQDIKRALQSFSKLLAVARRIPDIEGICNAHMELAFAYKQLDDHVHTETHLRLFRETAANFEFLGKLADAHYYTGEHYLSQGKPEIATSHLETALDLYNKLNLSDEADRARTIAGISKGQERIEQYIDLILRCGNHDQQATLKICRWKNRRENFWIEEKRDDSSANWEISNENSEATVSTSPSFIND